MKQSFEKVPYNKRLYVFSGIFYPTQKQVWEFTVGMFP